MEEETKKNVPVSEDVPAADGEGQEPGEENDKKKKPSLTFAKKLHTIRTAIANAQKPGLFNQYIADYGYDEARLNQGLTLVNTAETTHTAQQNAAAAKLEKTRLATAARSEATKIYAHYVVIGREEFKDNPHILDLLALNGQRKKDFGGWRNQAMLLYENISQPGVSEGFANHNITAAALDSGKQLVINAETAVTNAKEAKAEAEKATELKNKAYQELLDWWGDFIKVVNVAVKKDPQLKEQVSIVAPYMR